MRSSGDIQSCIIPSNISIFWGNNINKDYSSLIQVSFNEHKNLSMEERYNDDLELIKLFSGKFIKTITLKDFLELNKIYFLTINVIQLKLELNN